MLKSFINILKDNRGFFVFLLLMSVFRSGIADWNVVPSGSMKPTIVEGDRILVNKLAYDVQVPFLYYSLKKLNDPQRGDIIVFDSEVAQLRLVKRVIGLPGDIVEMVDNQLYINGQALQYDVLESHQNQIDEKEYLLGVEHTVRLNREGSRQSSFEPTKVPENYYLALGDNRDNSSDSRVIGFVPRDEIIGRAKRVVMSVDYDRYYMLRSDRFWKTL